MNTSVNGVGGLGSFSSSAPVGSEAGPRLLALSVSLQGGQGPGRRPQAEAESLGSPEAALCLLSQLTPTQACGVHTAVTLGDR